MNTPHSRANVVFFYGLSVLAALCCANWATSFMYDYNVEVTRLEAPVVGKLGQLPVMSFSNRRDAALLSLTADINVSGVFNWNTKQVFVYIQADVRTVNGAVFRAVVWDQVVNRTDSKLISLRNEEAEYPVLMLNTSDTLAGAEVALSVAWDVMPVSGGLRRLKGPASDMVAGGFVPRKPCFSLARCNKLLPAGAVADPRALVRALNNEDNNPDGAPASKAKAAPSGDELGAIALHPRAMGVFEDTQTTLLELWQPMTQSPACYVISGVAVFCLLLQLGTEAFARPMYLKRPGYTSEKANTASEDAAVRVVGLVFALYAAINSTTILATTSPENWTQFYLYEPRAESLMHVACGFFLWDLYSCLTSAWGGFFTAHAAVSLFVFAAALRPFLHHIGCVFLMYEASTVFMHLRHFAMELNWSATVPGAYDAVSIAFATTFFVARILIGLPLSVYWWWHMIAYIVRGEAHSVPIYVGYLFANAVITGLNIMWFSKIATLALRAAGRAMKGAKTSGSLLSPDALGVDEKSA